MIPLLARLAFGGMRRRPAQAVLVLTVVAAAAAALATALTIDDVADRPYDRTLEATRGAHVRAFGDYGDRALAEIAYDPDVVAGSPVRPIVFTAMDLDGRTFGLRMVQAPEEGADVDVPLIVAGRATLSAGEVVLERSFARTLDLEVGDRLIVGSQRLRLEVTGIAIVAQGEPYPIRQPGIVFARVDTLAAVQPDRSRWNATVGVRLVDPLTADAFAAHVGASVHTETWLSERHTSTEWLQVTRTILLVFSILLLFTGGGVLATLVSGRVLAQLRDIGLLKAAGMSPAQIAATITAEQVGLSLAGAVTGVLAGRLLSPVFVAESAALLDASQTPPLSLATCAMVVAGISTTVGVFAFVPAWRSGGRTTVDILTAATARAGHRSRVGRAAENLRLPLPVALGIREAFSRPARTWLLVGTLALAIAAAVATLGAEASLDIGATPAAAPAIDGIETPRWDPIDDHASDAGRLRPIIYGLDSVLLFTASANLLAAVMLGVRERRRDVSLLKVVGLTPAEIRRGFLAGQATVAVAATAVGIPIGLVLFRLSIEAAGSADEFAYPTWWWIVLLVPGAIATVLAVTAPYARTAANLRVSEALRAE